ncbi:uncharacterized membrane protein (DUF485 family) [Streptomyces sp. SLBN-118]|uniref:DUF485 domain-containing protein n=1 Tax=Streptomyces sp. SLBN-118 TaxID=2768454 RepID=UPI00114FDCB3|nr:DUF485 domain-containing protein [Streptomyces sp. SLBN-118]TQK50434.1 uncharacterized membrane protein (DUF485 family) [Streptomyces sp. SLBN-118]
MSHYPPPRSCPEFPEYPGQPRNPLHYWQEPAPPAPPRPPSDPHRDVRALSAAYRRLRRVATLTALGYFVLFLILSAYAPDLMTSKITGGLNIALLLGLIQLPVSLIAVAAYERSARRRVDPLADAMRRRAAPTTQGAGR